MLKALLNADTADKHHRTRSLLAFALTEKSPPEWQRAKELLDKAIAIRDREHGPGHEAARWNEFYRAACNIALDQAFANGQTSAPAQRGRIEQELEAARTWRDAKAAWGVRVQVQR